MIGIGRGLPTWKREGAVPCPSARAKGTSFLAATLLTTIFAVLGCRAETQSTSVVRLAAAASLRDAVAVAAQRYERATGTRVELNFAGSNTLAAQILAGDTADVFLSANQQWVGELITRGRVAPENSVALLSNELVFVTHKDSALVLRVPSDLLSPTVGMLAVGQPDAVPAGLYARDCLQRVPIRNATLWRTLSDKVLPTADVRAALAAAHARRDIVAAVYKTDVRANGDMKIQFACTDQLAPKIEYTLALVTAAQGQRVGRDLYNFLRSPPALEIFREHGFLIPGATQ